MLFELLTVLLGWVDSFAADMMPPCPIPPHPTHHPRRLIPLALQIARPVYVNEVDKDVQNSIVCSLCSAPEETNSTSLSVLADVTYIL